MNFFQMPNFLWDREDLDVYERVILTHIIRQTIGWGKSEDGISLTQFQKQLNISRPTIVKALKGLIKKGIIIKRSTYLDNGSQHFNIYFLTKEIIELANKESQKVVNEINGGSKADLQGQSTTFTGGSKRDLQGVVNEVYTQNTTNTKYTNTKEIKEKNIKKENFSEKEIFSETALEDIEVQVLLKELQVDKTFLQSLIAYREKIKPIKTIAGLKKVLKDLRDTRLQSKKSAYELFEIMQENEWLTIKSNYIKPKKDTDLVEHNSDEAIDNAIDGFLKMTEGMEL